MQAVAPIQLLPKKCVSRRAFTIRLRPLGVKLTSATVRVNGKKVSVRKGRRLRATIPLKGLPKGTFTVSIDARGADGFRYRESRRYRTCLRKLRGLNGPNGKVRKSKD